MKKLKYLCLAFLVASLLAIPATAQRMGRMGQMGHHHHNNNGPRKDNDKGKQNPDRDKGKGQGPGQGRDQGAAQRSSRALRLLGVAWVRQSRMPSDAKNCRS